jgi:hypothetical protein
MKFHNAGKYNGDESSLPQREHPEGFVPFKEAQDMKKLSIIANTAAIIVTALCVIGWSVYGGLNPFDEDYFLWVALSTLLVLVPHEFLHAVCFKEDVYMYNNLNQGMMFVVGTEDMSRARFVVMSLCPNIVFGFIPYILYFLFPNLGWLGLFGAFNIGMGCGDYYNVINALTQMPKKAKTYLCGMHSFRYIPKEENKR